MQTKNEKRKFKRFPLLVVRYKSKHHQGIHGAGNILDVSREGFRILSATALAHGTVLDFVIHIPHKADICCQGKVRWTEPVEVGHCQGLSFLEIDPLDRTLLVDYIYGAWVAGEKTKDQL